MKTVYLIIIVLAIMLGACRPSDDEDSAKQSYSFELEDSRNGKLEIENPQKHLVLYSGEEELAPIYNNLMRYFEFSRVKYDEKDILDDTGVIEDYSSIILLSKDYTGISKEIFSEIMDFADKGGNLIFLSVPYSSPFNTYMGIEEEIDYIGTEEIDFKKSFFPGIHDVKGMESGILGSSLEVSLGEDTQIIAVGNKSIPIIWEKNLGRGRILSVNTTIIGSKMARGLLAQIISYGNDYFIAPIFNSRVVHIDNFPAPIPSQTNREIYEEYGLNTNDFFEEVWWEDMGKLAARADLKYTANMIAEYTEITDKEMMKNVYQINTKDLRFFGMKILESGGELGVHGYNQNPLFLQGEMDAKRYNYSSWKDRESIVYSIEKLRGVIDDLYGKDLKLYTYTPPGNFLDSEGKKILADNLPDLKTISGIYTEIPEEGILIQEVGRDPDIPGLYSIPRFSSGFGYSKDKMWRIYNGIAAYGLASHYIYLYEALSLVEDKDSRSWNNIMTDFKRIFLEIQDNFPQMEGQVQSDATKRYISLEEADISHEMKGDEINISIENYTGEINTFIRVREKEIIEVAGGEYTLVESSLEYNLYLVKLQSEDIKVYLGGS